MRKIILAAAIAGSALTLSACSEGTEEAAEATADSMAADTEANMDAVGEGAEEMVAEGEAVLDGAEAEIQDESVAEADAD